MIETYVHEKIKSVRCLNKLFMYFFEGEFIFELFGVDR